jgi:outer membrane immunogenic protein
MHFNKLSHKATLLATLALSFQINARDWSGCYLGANVGYGDGNNQLDIELFQDIAYDDRSAGSASSSGSLYGLQFGCDYQPSEKWVLGAQLSGSEVEVDGRHLFIDGTGPNNYVTYETDQLLSLTGKLGYLVKDSTLLYSKLGWVSTEQRYFDTDPFYDPPLRYQKSLTRSGWSVGVGVEHKFLENVSFFIEMNRVELGTEKNIPFDNLGEIEIDDYVASIDQSLNQFMVGLNYYF